MITLTFSPLTDGSQITVRAKFFRICADATLRGPENSVVASYASDVWRLGSRTCRKFQCEEPVFLRVTNVEGAQERLGPFLFLRVSEGVLCTDGKYVGRYTPKWNVGAEAPYWREIALLSSP